MSDEVLFQHPALPHLLPLPDELRRKEITPNQVSDDSESLVASFNQSTSGICVRERLRDHIRFWRDIGASNFVLRVLEIGYFLPFLNCLPCGRFFNLPSAFSHAPFASSSMEKLFSGRRSYEVLRVRFGVDKPVGCSAKNKETSCVLY